METLIAFTGAYLIGVINGLIIMYMTQSSNNKQLTTKG
jgi:hypothetical protein